MSASDRRQRPGFGPELHTRSVTRAALGLRGRPEHSYDLAGPIPPRPRLAVVGSRAARASTLAALAPVLARAQALGWSLVSGGALGVDGAVHRLAVERGIAQLAVLPCGSDYLYPPGHRGLFAAMLEAPEAGLLFAQPRGAQPRRGMFASRNQLVVGLCDAVLVAAAGLRSGSSLTGRLALRAGLPLAALAGTRGCGALIGAGARGLPAPPHDGDPAALARLTAAFEAWLCGASDEGVAWPEELRWLERALAEAGPAGLSADASADPGATTLALCQAELLGLVSEASPGRWVESI
ncbi:DNA-processing protein DprA [Pseudenhygromyxa sp. WMMC2535]|uniref:DNA-processing protein DprA n=1 Tax=Pseudenhygromyxa sp. WMMC2535 TaxID=2712867 RepID=UPI001554B8AE|nr:DNA-processing protein DprA [Pseudenhygromyxa sp. WMMC2535]